MPAFTNQTAGFEPLGSNVFRQATMGEDFEPTTGQVLSNYAGSAYFGTGSGYADAQAGRVKASQYMDEPFNSEEDFQKSGKYNRAVKFYKGLTPKGAKILSETADEDEARNFVISKASTAQNATGMLTALGVGIFEPKNVAYGLITAGVGEIAGNSIRMKRIYDVYKNMSKYKRLAAIGGTEGLVSAALAEPSNRYSAQILQRDYDMTDSLFNVATSTLFGAGVRALPPMLGERVKLYRDNKIRAKDEIYDELDSFAKQVLQGQEPDADHIRAVREADLDAAPYAERAKKAEEFARYTETPEFKERFADSKITDANGNPKLVFHGTTKDFAQFDSTKTGDFQLYKDAEGIYFTDDPNTASAYADGENGNVRPTYLAMNNPKHLDQPPAYISPADRQDLESQGFDGVTYKNPRTGANEYVAFQPEQAIPAFGADNMDAIIGRRSAENTARLKELAGREANPANSTAYDHRGIDEVKAFAEQYPEDNIADDLAKYEQEIAAMKDQGLLSEEDMAALEHLSTFKEEDMLRSYKDVYLCLTKG